MFVGACTTTRGASPARGSEMLRSPQDHYVMRVQGHLDFRRAEWFDDMTITQEADWGLRRRILRAQPLWFL